MESNVRNCVSVVPAKSCEHLTLSYVVEIARVVFGTGGNVAHAWADGYPKAVDSVHVTIQGHDAFLCAQVPQSDNATTRDSAGNEEIVGCIWMRDEE